MSNFINKLEEAIRERKKVASVTIIKEEGSSPRGVGSAMLIDEYGELLSGTIGGGNVEYRAKDDALDAIKMQKSQTKQYVLNDSGELGMVCGGSVEVFIQVYIPKDLLIIIGGGHICEQLYLLALQQDYDVMVIDDRQAYANAKKYPQAQCYAGHLEEILETIETDAQTSIVIMTHGHRHDTQALLKVISKEYRYIGMIGSQSKLTTCFEACRAKGIDEKLLQNIHGPIGLDIGGETPSAIALAIMSEIQMVKYNRTGKPLKAIKGVL